MKTTSKRRKKKSKLSKSSTAMILFATVLVAIIIVILLYPTQPQKPPAREYFEIFDIVALAEPGDPENNTIRIKQLDFKIKPIGGDAHDLLIIPPSAVPQEYWPNFEGKVIRRNETVSLSGSGQEIIFQSSVLSVRNENGSYPLTLRIRCDETSDLPKDQKVTIYITKWIPIRL
jgi:hypothetical protein